MIEKNTSTTTKEALEPCPFCGAEAAIYYYGGDDESTASDQVDVGCAGGCTITPRVVASTDAEAEENLQWAIAEWNTRARVTTPIVAPVVDENSAAFAAYNQAIEDAKAAIRDESQGGGYWAATYINAIARRCSPFRYTGLPSDADDTTREQIVQAITDIQEARESHVQWANHLRNEKHALCEGCDQFAAHIGDAEYHDEWIAKYDNVIAVLARVPFATTPPSTLAKAAAEEIDRLLVPLREYAKTPGINQMTAIIERCLSAGGVS